MSDTRKDIVLSGYCSYIICTRRAVQGFHKKISRHTSTIVYNNVYDSHHMYTRSIYHNLSFKFRKYLSHMSITGKVNTMNVTDRQSGARYLSQ